MQASTTPSAYVCTSVFTHPYRPAVTAKPPHAEQRRYGAPMAGHSDHVQRLVADSDPETGRFGVLRIGEQDLAYVQMEIGGHSGAHIQLRMTPAELREAAARLLDAAHDIEVFPSTSLLPAQQGVAT